MGSSRARVSAFLPGYLLVAVIGCGPGPLPAIQGLVPSPGGSTGTTQGAGGGGGAAGTAGMGGDGGSGGGPGGGTGGTIVVQDPDAGAADTLASSGQPAMTVFAKDDGLAETNMTQPRITVENSGTASITGFEVRYYFTITEAMAPVIDIYYSPEAQLSLVQETTTRWYVRETYQRELDPGQFTESGDGLTYGLHFASWAAWDKSDDESHQGLTGTMAETTHIDVFDGQGHLLAGDVTP